MGVCPLLLCRPGHIPRIRVVARDQGEISEAHLALRGDAGRGGVVGLKGYGEVVERLISHANGPPEFDVFGRCIPGVEIEKKN